MENIFYELPIFFKTGSKLSLFKSKQPMATVTEITPPDEAMGYFAGVFLFLIQ